MRGARQAVSSSWSQSEWVGGVLASPGKSERREGAAAPAGSGALSRVLTRLTARWPQRGADQRLRRGRTGGREESYIRTDLRVVCGLAPVAGKEALSLRRSPLKRMLRSL